MDKHIPSKKLFLYFYELEKFESTTLEEQVIEKAEKAGFINDTPSIENQSKLAWIKKVTKYAEDAFKLEEGEPLEITIDNLEQLIELRDKQVSDIIELLAKKTLDAVPPYCC